MKNLFKILALVFAAFTSAKSVAQNAIFLKQGNILFEKKVNMYAMIEQEIKQYPNDAWLTQYLEAFKKGNPQFQSTNYNLAFNGDKTLYKPTDQSDNNNSFYSYSSKNIIYSDLDKSEAVAFKKVFEDNFLVTDSTRKIHWKITDEIRDIAGFKCRRANAIIMDSVYVVAFFTPKIPTTGGPESFNGLPGMILGVALPYDHITWFAQKISVDPPIRDTDITPPTKGQKVTTKDLYLKLKSAMKDWGSGGASVLKSVML